MSTFLFSSFYFNLKHNFDRKPIISQYSEKRIIDLR